MSEPTAEVLPIEEPSTIIAVLQTRCGCTRALDIPAVAPRTITVEMAPIPGDEKAVRTFYNTGKWFTNGLLYVEGPNPAPRIIVPGLTGTGGTPGRRPQILPC